ncbi:MAG: RidA family protein [Candidatus Hodarchaeota archaeon]
MKEVFLSEKAPKPVGPYSQCVKYGHLLFLSGQIPINPETNKIVSNNFEEQVKQVMENLKNVLKAANSSFDNVLKTQVFLKDLTKFKKFNEIYSKYFSEKPPARTTVEVAKLPLDSELEIDIIAFTE